MAEMEAQEAARKEATEGLADNRSLTAEISELRGKYEAQSAELTRLIGHQHLKLFHDVINEFFYKHFEQYK